MSPRTKIRIANVFMLAGLAPLLLGVYWIATVINYAQHHKGQMGGSDAFLMMGVLFITYAFAFVVSGSSALWSISVVRRHAELRTMPATAIKSLVGIALLAPWLWIGGARLFYV
jgi:hypothetical protein